MARDCPSCSTQNIDGARFCRSCGTVLQPSSPTTPTSIVDPPYQSSPMWTSPVQYPRPDQYSNPNPYQSPNQYQGNPTPIVPMTPDYGSKFQQYNPAAGWAQSYILAGFGSRFAAYLIDQIPFILFVVPSYLFLLGTQNARNGANGAAALLLMLSVFITFVYWVINIYLLGSSGATIGKKALGLKCLGPDGQTLGFGKAFLRELVKFALAQFCIIMLFVDNLWMLSDNENQTLHDKTVGTHVFKL